MKKPSIVLNRRGSGARSINIEDLKIPVLPSFVKIARKKQGTEIYRLLHDVTNVITAMKSGAKLPESIFIPDLWHAAMRMPSKEQEAVLTLWHLAHDLVRETGYKYEAISDDKLRMIGSPYVRGAVTILSPTVFLSHQSKDKVVVRNAANYLQDRMEVVLDEWSFCPGKTLTSEIEEGIRRSDALVLFWSKNSAFSKYVQFEDELAISRKVKDERFSIQVVRLDDTDLPERYERLIYHDWRKGRSGSNLFKSHLARLHAAIDGIFQETVEL